MGREDASQVNQFLAHGRGLLMGFIERLERDNEDLFAELQAALPRGYGLLQQYDEMSANERVELLRDEELADPRAELMRQEQLRDIRTGAKTVSDILVYDFLRALEFGPDVVDDEDLKDRITDALAGQLGYKPHHKDQGAEAE
jgi:hypothetical protein